MDDPMTRRADLVADLREAVFESPGETSQMERVAAGIGGLLAEPWASYAEKVRDHSYRVTDADIAALKAAGCGEEEIFEITIAAAQGAALRRLDAGLRALNGEA